MTPALLHKINLNGCDEIFCEMVIFNNLHNFLHYSITFFLFFIKILQFSSQCIHQKVHFTAFGLFSVDFSMILMVSSDVFFFIFWTIKVWLVSDYRSNHNISHFFDPICNVLFETTTERCSQIKITSNNIYYSCWCKIKILDWTEINLLK